ncbi:alkaline phosphatase [Planctomycetota bacterium]|nr:alkaline phosphatase [Planctomycetota bacterium]
MKFPTGILAAAAITTMIATDANAAVKNVILMVSDGAGYNTHLSTEYYTGSKAAYQNANWSQYATSTYNLRQGAGSLDNNDQDPNLIYDPAKVWDTTPNAGSTGSYPNHFNGYEWLKSTSPDSAGTMSSMVTGQKVYRGGMNVDGFGNNLLTAPEIAKANGKMVGTISSVRYNHATVAAGGGAHNISRNNYLDLGYELFGAGVADLIGGAGNPEFDDNGQAVSASTLSDRLNSGSRFDTNLWNALKTGSGSVSRTTVDGRNFTVNGNDWDLHTTKSSIEGLANGSITATPGKKLALMPEVYGTLQYSRSNAGNNDPVYDDPYNANVPSLEAMTEASLNYLDDDADGFFLSIEGGAVDWAMHGNKIGRMIEEQIDFDNSVQAVADYLDAGTNGNDWSNTLVIVTADHDHMLFGPDSDTNPHQPVTDNGAGNLPGYQWHYSSHSNQLVPTWIRGADSNIFAPLADSTDPIYGNYMDQTDIGNVVTNAVPEPASLVLIAFGTLATLGRRRK